MHIALEDAFLCPDCSAVHSSSRQCPSCTNQAEMFSLSAIINRKPVQAESEQVLSLHRELMCEEVC